MLTDVDVDRILDQIHEEAREISQTCRQMLHAFDGHDVMWQGLAIAELVARWISAHPAGMRESVLKTHDQLVAALVDANNWRCLRPRMRCFGTTSLEIQEERQRILRSSDYGLVYHRSIADDQGPGGTV